jgi:hypothetical protein
MSYSEENGQVVLTHEQAIDWAKLFAGFDRFILLCPQCKTGGNSRYAGGSHNCFHCGSCAFVECEVTG